MNLRFLFLSGLVPFAASASIAVADTPASSAQVKQLLDSQSCTLCHHNPGMAKPLSAYTGSSPARLKGAILDPKKTLGASTTMPSYEGKLTASQVDALVAFIKAGGS
jgi:cytochrome c553